MNHSKGTNCGDLYTKSSTQKVEFNTYAQRIVKACA